MSKDGEVHVGGKIYPGDANIADGVDIGDMGIDIANAPDT